MGVYLKMKINRKKDFNVPDVYYCYYFVSYSVFGQYFWNYLTVIQRIQLLHSSSLPHCTIQWLTQDFAVKRFQLPPSVPVWWSPAAKCILVSFEVKKIHSIKHMQSFIRLKKL